MKTHENCWGNASLILPVTSSKLLVLVQEGVFREQIPANRGAQDVLYKSRAEGKG